MSFNLTAIQIERRVKSFSPRDCVNYLRSRDSQPTKINRYWQERMQIPPGLSEGEYISHIDFFIILHGKHPFFPPFTSGIRPGFVEFLGTLTDCQRHELFYCTVPRVNRPNTAELFNRGVCFSDKVNNFIGNIPVSKDELELVESTPPKYEVYELLQEWFVHLTRTESSYEEFFFWIQKGQIHIRDVPRFNPKFPDTSIFKTFLRGANSHTLLCFENYKEDYKVGPIINADLQRGYHFNHTVADFVKQFGYEEWMRTYLKTRIYDVPSVNYNLLLEMDETTVIGLTMWPEEQTLFSQLYGLVYPVPSTVFPECLMSKSSLVTDVEPKIVIPVRETIEGLHPTGIIIPELRIEAMEGPQEKREYIFPSGRTIRFYDAKYDTQAQIDFFKKNLCVPFVVTLVKDVHGHYRPPTDFGVIFATDTDEFPLSPSYHDGVWMFQHPLKSKIEHRNVAVCSNCLSKVNHLTYSLAFCRHKFRSGAMVNLRYSPNWFLGAVNKFYRNNLSFVFKSSSIKTIINSRPDFVFLPGARSYSTIHTYASRDVQGIPFTARNEEYTVPFLDDTGQSDMYPLGYPLAPWDRRGMPFIDNHGIPECFSMLPKIDRNEYFYYKWDWELDAWLVRFGYGNLSIVALPGFIQHLLVARLGEDVGIYLFQVLIFFYMTRIVHVYDVGPRIMEDSTDDSSEEGEI
jgi:hypothetical protein